jgi:hypothetical protein
MTKPTSILDPRFKYTPSSKTDISRTFARVKKEIRGGQDNQKPLVEPTLQLGAFVLSAEWFEVLE